MSAKRLPFQLGILLVTALLAGGAEVPADPEAKAKRVHVLTREGDVLLGSVDLESVTIDTRYGALTVPVADLRRVDFSWQASAEEAAKVQEYLQELEDPAGRKTARSGILEVGPVALPRLYAPGLEADKEVTDVLEEIRGELEARKGRRSLEEDVILMKPFNVVGRVRLDALEIETTYGPLRIARHDLDRLLFGGSGAFRDVDKVLIVRTWTDVDEEYAHTRSAIARFSKLKLVEFTGSSAGALKKALVKHSVLVLPEFESGGSAAQAAAREAGTALKKFVREGGVVISCGGTNNANFLTASGLLTCRANSNDSTGTIRKRHPIVKGVKGGVPSINATIPLTQVQGRKMKSIVTSPSGATIVGIATYGSGAIVYCGWDFYRSGDAHQRILANCVEWAATRQFSGLPF